MTGFKVYCKGKPVSSERCVAVIKGTAPSGVGVFESMRTYGGRIFREKEHLERLEESARTAGVPIPLREAIQKELNAALRAAGEDQDVFVRLTVIAGEVYVMIGRRSHPEHLYKQGIVLKTTPVRQPAVNAAAPQAKTNAYQTAVLAALQPLKEYERLFLDRDGYVSEVSIGNFFALKAGRLITPPASGILNGVTRRFVLECALAAKIPLEERLFTRHDVYNAGEAFLTNTSWEILPVRELDGRPVGKKVPGPLTLKIHRIFKQKVSKECPQSKSAAR